MGLALAAWWSLHRSASTTPGVTDLGRQELEAAAQRGELCSPQNRPGLGLQGDYYERAAYGGSKLPGRLDPSIDFVNGLGFEASQPSPGSIRWTGWIRPPMTGHYRFHATPQIAAIYVSRSLVGGSQASPDVSIELHAGRYAPISIEVPDVGIPGRLRVEWTLPHGARQVIPRALLFPPSGPTLQSAPVSGRPKVPTAAATAS